MSFIGQIPDLIDALMSFVVHLDKNRECTLVLTLIFPLIIPKIRCILSLLTIMKREIKLFSSWSMKNHRPIASTSRL